MPLSIAQALETTDRNGEPQDELDGLKEDAHMHSSKRRKLSEATVGLKPSACAREVYLPTMKSTKAIIGATNVAYSRRRRLDARRRPARELTSMERLDREYDDFLASNKKEDKEEWRALKTKEQLPEKSRLKRVRVPTYLVGVWWKK